MTNAAGEPAAYDDWAELYDLTAPDRSAELGFYEAFVGPACGSLLDLGCGSGALTIPLARAIRRHHAEGFIVGLDESAAMLDIARRLEPTVQWIHGDMRRPQIQDRFDLLLCGFNTLQLLLNDEDLLAMLRSVRQLAADGGRFVFDIYQPNVDYLRTPIVERTVRSFSVGQRVVEVRETGSYDPTLCVLTSDWTFVERADSPSRSQRTVRSRLRQYFAEDIDRLLAVAGWRIEERYGFYDRSPFTPTSKKQLVVCVPDV